MSGWIVPSSFTRLLLEVFVNRRCWTRGALVIHSSPQIVLFPTIPFLSHYDSDMPPLNVGHFLHCAYETTLFLSVRIEFLAL